MLNSLIDGTGADQSMEAFRDSFIAIDGTEVIRTGGAPTITIGANSNFIAVGAQSEIENTAGGRAINIIIGSVAEIDNAEITGNVDIDELSYIAFESPGASPSMVTGDINVSRGSVLVGRGGGSLTTTAVGGAITCDTDSRISGSGNFSVVASCTPF